MHTSPSHQPRRQRLLYRSISLTLSLLLLFSRLTPPLVSASATNDAACARLQQSRGWQLPSLAHADVPPSFCASVWLRNTVNGRYAVRGMTALPQQAGVLLIERNAHSLTWANDTNGNGYIDDNTNEHVVLFQDASIVLTHSVTVDSAATYVYASTAAAVYRWPFDTRQPSRSLSTPQTVISGIPTAGHITRTVLLSPDQQWLYVSVGSGANVDAATDRALIMRYHLPSLPSTPAGFAYTDGEVSARGVRNDVGIAFDRYGVLWGVGLGADWLQRPDLGGGNIANDNPAEEIHKFTTAGQFHGYPYCWSEWRLPAAVAKGAGTQWAWNDYSNDGVHSDEWCRNESNNTPPHAVFQAHAAPLGLKFYPTDMKASGDATPFAQPQPQPQQQQSGSSSGNQWLLIPQHGSSARDVPVGYRVQRFLANDVGADKGGIVLARSSGSDATAAAAGLQTDDSGLLFDTLLKYDVPTAAYEDGWIRPVDIVVGQQGELYISNDRDTADAAIVVLRYVADSTQTSGNSATGSVAADPTGVVSSGDGGGVVGQSTGTNALDGSTGAAGTSSSPATGGTTTSQPEQRNSAVAAATFSLLTYALLLMLSTVLHFFTR